MYYMEVSICCSALYTIGTSQMAEYTLNELTDVHLVYGDTEDPSPTSQLILQPLFRFSYVTGSSLTSTGEPPMRYSCINFI